MSENTELERLQKIADKLATLDLHVKTREEMETEINAILERTKDLSDDEIEKQFDEALAEIRAQVKEAGITEEDVEAEIRAVHDINATKEDLAVFENQYGMSTIEFFRKYISGETDDHMDFIEWASLAQMIVHLSET